MFSEYFEDEYRTHVFLLKGTREQIEAIKCNPEYEVEVLSEQCDPHSGVCVIEVSRYTCVEDIISGHPEIMAAGFVEDWGEFHDVYVAFSPQGSSEIYDCVRVGFFDGHNDINWHDSCPVDARGREVRMGYSGEYDTVVYNFPFSSQWECFDVEKAAQQRPE